MHKLITDLGRQESHGPFLVPAPQQRGQPISSSAKEAKGKAAQAWTQLCSTLITHKFNTLTLQLTGRNAACTELRLLVLRPTPGAAGSIPRRARSRARQSVASSLATRALPPSPPAGRRPKQARSLRWRCCRAASFLRAFSALLAPFCARPAGSAVRKRSQRQAVTLSTRTSPPLGPARTRSPLRALEGALAPRLATPPGFGPQNLTSGPAKRRAWPSGNLLRAPPLCRCPRGSPRHCPAKLISGFSNGAALLSPL